MPNNNNKSNNEEVVFNDEAMADLKRKNESSTISYEYKPAARPTQEYNDNNQDDE